MTNTTRTADLARMLQERRLELGHVVHARLRDGRSREAKDVRDLGEDSVAEHQGDLDRSLLQMRAQTIARIDEALVRLAAGKYGSCVACEGEISQVRLRAMPFAVRCRSCEDKREQASRRASQLARNGGAGGLAPDSVGT